jgi:hypothetical protein
MKVARPPPVVKSRVARMNRIEVAGIGGNSQEGGGPMHINFDLTRPDRRARLARTVAEPWW